MADSIQFSMKSWWNVRPPTYYGDGPFDAPSSDEDETLLEKHLPSSPGIAERGNTITPRRPSSLRLLIIALASLVALSGIIGIIAAHSYVGTVYHAPGVKKISMDHVFNGTFDVDRRSLAWVPEARDGVFSIWEDGYIKLVDLKTNTTKDLVYTFDVKSVPNLAACDLPTNGLPLSWASWKLSPDMKYILVKSDHRKHAATLKSRACVTVVPPPPPPPASHYNLGAPSPAAQHTMHRRCPRRDGVVRLAPSTEHVRVLSHTAMIWLCKRSTGHADDLGLLLALRPAAHAFVQKPHLAELLLSGMWCHLQRVPLPIRALADAHAR
ncbi:hypothetical protein B0H14DRAFT_3696496 [Mycena olivaceomarginata]|nr:hypothetical protein B0H14DRAFT_3696496 [Mycena olivaceomarginata]